MVIFMGSNAETFYNDNMCATADVRSVYGGASYTISSSVYDIDKVFEDRPDDDIMFRAFVRMTYYLALRLKWFWLAFRGRRGAFATLNNRLTCS